MENDASGTITSRQLLDRLNWRYATKQFDPNRKISTQDWVALEEALLLTPSSGGLQPWKFIVVTDPATRVKLLPASFGHALSPAH
jgi:nitroreductase